MPVTDVIVDDYRTQNIESIQSLLLFQLYKLLGTPPHTSLNATAAPQKCYPRLDRDHRD
jgi:hypothetical protein